MFTSAPLLYIAKTTPEALVDIIMTYQEQVQALILTRVNGVRVN